MSNKKTAHNYTNFSELIAGLVVVALLIIIKIQVEKTDYGHWFNARGYEILHSFIPTYNPNEEFPVIVLDISDLQSDSTGIPPNGKLQEIVEALVQSRAKAIAIDIDYSIVRDPQNPSLSISKFEENKKLFDFLHEQKKKDIPVFVGSYNIGVEPSTWLGLTKYKDLAADMTLNPDDSTEVPAWLQCNKNNPETKLNSISKALAEAYGNRPQPPGWLKYFLKDYEDEHNLKPVEKSDESRNKITCQRAVTLVNYAKLELIQKLSLQTLNKDSVLEVLYIEFLNFLFQLALFGVPI